MKNIFLDARMSYNSGIGTYIRTLYSLLSNEFDIKALCFEDFKSLFKNHEITNTPIYTIKELKGWKAPEASIYWTPHYNVPLLPTKAKKRLVTIHDVFHLEHFKTLSLSQKVYAKLAITGATQLSDSIITVSEFSKNEIIKHTNVNPSKINVIHNGVDLDKFSTISYSKAQLIEILKIPQDYILFVGNVKPHKNLIVLLKAMYALKLSKKSVCPLVIVGKKDGFITGDLQIDTYITTYLKDEVYFTGYVEDSILPALYQNALLFVFPSLYEGFGLPPLEAMAANCPVLCSTAASLPEVCGNSVEYFNPTNEEELAFKLDTLVSDSNLLNQLITKGLNHVSNFTWENSAKKHANLLNKLY